MLKALIALLLFLTSILLCAQEKATMTAYEFVNGSWFDGTSFQKRTWYSVNGILHPNRPFDVDKVIDLQGMYVIPACGEAHNHNATNDNPAALKRYIHDGILYVWNPSNLPNQRVGEFINTPKGVDVKFSNGGLTAPGGHPLGLVKRNIERGAMKESDGEGAFYFTIGSAADLDAKWPKIVAGAPDFVKTFLVYSEEYAKRKDDPKYFSRRGLDPALLPLIVRKAEQANLPVVAHVESAHDFHVAVGAGVRQINHMPGFWPNDESLKDGDFSRYRITDDDARRAGRKHITVVTTISESLEMIRDKKLPDAIGAKLLDTYRSNLALLKKHHVPILIGSDRFRLESQTEAIALVSSGLMTNLETLKAWCETTPQAMFSNRRLGRIKDGYEANFFAVPSDPLNNFENVKDVRRVFKNGEELARE